MHGFEMEPNHRMGYAALCRLTKETKGKASLNVPVKTLRAMMEAYEDILDVLAYDAAKATKTEYFPKALADRLIAGVSPVKVFREHRGMTQQKLAALSGVSRDMIAMIETGKKNGSLTTIKKLAKALRVDIEDLV
jgi:DNA-binding XRE family transcriptional regulator